MTPAEIHEATMQRATSRGAKITQNQKQIAQHKHKRVKDLILKNPKATVREISDLAHVSQNVVRYVFEKFAIPIPVYKHRKEWTLAQEKQLREFVSQGLTSAKIAELTGRTRNSITARMAQLGLARRSQKALNYHLTITVTADLKSGVELVSKVKNIPKARYLREALDKQLSADLKEIRNERQS